MINFLHRHRNSNADSPRSRRLSLDRCLVQSLRFTVPAFRNEVRARKTEPTTTTQDRARRRAFEQICLLTNGGLIGVIWLLITLPPQSPWRSAIPVILSAAMRARRPTAEKIPRSF